MPDASRTARVEPVRAAHGEVDAVWVRDGRIAVEGALVSASDSSQAGIDTRSDGAGATLVARERTTGREVRADATIEGARFAAALEVAPLVAAATTATETWDLFLDVAGRGKFRIGRQLDDIAQKKHVLVYPSVVRGEGGGRRRLRPYYTTTNNLSIVSKAAPPDRGLADHPAGRAAPAPSRPSRRGSAVHERALLQLAKGVRRAAVRGTRALIAQRGPQRGADARSRTRITFLIVHAYGMGGTIRTVLNLAGYLAREHDVEVVSVLRTRRQPFFSFPMGITVTSLDDRTVERPPLARAAVALLRSLPSVLVHPEEVSYRGSSLWRDLVLVRKLRALRSGILVTTRPAFNLLAAELAPPGVVKVGQEHLNLRAHRPGLAREIGRQYPKLDALAVLTDDDLRDYGDLLGRAPVRLVRIPNSLPELPGAPSSLSEPLVVAAGRLTPQKGFDRLIPAFARVAERRPEWKLRIYGSGPNRRALQRLVFEHELYNNVVLMGKARALGRELAKASIFALSSRIEGMPMVILEAMSKRLPVVAFDCPTGPRQLITAGHDGLLVPDGDLEAFAAALLELIEDDEKRHRMGAAAFETARRYELDAVGRQWSDLLRELQEARAAAGGTIAYRSKNLSLDRI